MADKQKQLVLAIIDFLNESIENNQVKQDDREGLEVAIQCIGEAFGVDITDEQQREKLSIKPAKLQNIFDVFLKTKEKVGPQSTSSTPSSLPTAAAPKTASADDTARAEKLKLAGNSHMTSKKYQQAIDAYTEAIALDPSNAVYYSNRAAAYASKGDHLTAVADAEKAIELDPGFVKAYSRLGHAQYSLGDYTAAAAAFRRGLEVDPTNSNLKLGLQSAEERIVDDDVPPLERASSTTPSPPNPAGGLGGMADMLRNMGGGGQGGMPDISSLLNNPAMMQMAQQMMANGGMERMMSNPTVASMMNNFQNSGSLPSMEEIMSDPALRNMASQFGLGGGR